MRRIEAIIDGITVFLNVPETSSEYREGARASGNVLGESEGYLFKYDLPQKLAFENTGVPFELKVLFLTNLDSVSVVAEEATLLKDSSKVAASFTPYTAAIELRSDFCHKYKIGVGSLITFSNTGEEND